MKTIKFEHKLVGKILSGDKTSTWRLFDDKDLQVGDNLTFIEKESGKEFAHAIITEISLTELENTDWKGKYESKEVMYEEYKRYYGVKVTPKSVLKIVSFKLIK